jgi:hypothetical protein
LTQQVEGGLNVLKRRIVTGEGKFSESEIPSVIGTGVQTDEAKIQIFEMIQKCVVARAYGAASPPSGAERSDVTPEISIQRSACRQVGEGEYSIILSGDASGPPDAAYLLYAEVSNRKGGYRWRPACSQWRDAKPSDDEYWWKFSCFHGPGDRAHTVWKLSATLRDSDEPTTAVVSLLEPKVDKESMANVSIELACGH